MRDDEVQDDEDEFKTVAVTIRVIISYDANKRQRTEATAVHRFVHGRKAVAQVDGRKKRYYYPGLVSRPGVDKIGQSVLLMREKDAEDFTAFLARLHVPYTTRRVWLRSIDLY
jgi:hypothetical protein